MEIQLQPTDLGIGHDVDLALVRVDDERLLASIAGPATRIQGEDSDDGLISIPKELCFMRSCFLII